MDTQVGYARLLRQNRDFRYLFGARLISLFGDWFNTLAVLALLRELGAGTASDLGWVLVFKTLPTLLASPLAGVLADRLPRRRLLIGADLVRAGIVACMLGLVILRSVPLLYTLVVLQSVASTFFEPARTALLPRILQPGELTAANALGAAAWSSMLAFGAAAGGLVTAELGWQIALICDVGTYLLSALLLLLVHEPPRRAPPATVGWRGWTGLDDIQAGLRYLARRPRVATLALAKTGWTTAGAITLMLTLLGERIYPILGDPMLGVALFYTARGVGTGVGPLLARALSRSNPAAMERLILGGFACGAAFYGALPLADNAWVTAVMVAFAHLGGATVWVFSTVRLQQLLPDEVAGRVFAAELAGFTVAMAGSTMLWSALTDHEVASVQALTGALGGALALAAALWWLRGWRLGWAGPAATEEAGL